MSAHSDSVVLSGDDMKRAITRMAHEIMEKNPDPSTLVIVGIITRGRTLAERISAELKKINGAEVPVGSLDVTFYRDDIGEKGPNLQAAKTDIPFELPGKTVVLVDDVLYTGRSIRAAIDHLIDIGRPARIQLAVLLDRGHRELPIRPDYVGKNIPTSRSQRVHVKVSETDGQDSVVLIEGGQ
ncbi:MAG: bifunctional pyr operon transcriptional regulator/uracil phosphoribosyltransferase PyrR [Nitrospinota bacterium]